MECLRNSFQNGVVIGGRYQTISPLNHGSFGMVFMAEDLQTNQIVAIKCMTKKTAATEGVEFTVDDQSEELFCHRRLGEHPGIVNSLDNFETDAHVYIVLEFCSQGDLYEAIRTGYGPLETEHVRSFMIELVDAVSYMHSKGIYHRDIKPENIFLTETGSMKLGDFGLATTDKWSYEMTVGSDRYMAPEQYDSAGAGYSPAQADIWAIGICLLNILFSRNPFTAPTEADPLFLDFSRDKQSLFDVFPTMSQDTYEVIVHCMNMDPAKRSLVGAKNALRRVVSFTTDDEDDDEFCCAEGQPMATANREPLRTPSIQSPQIEQGAFPWAKALHTGPVRQLSVIHDTESYTEDLFPKSEDTADWMSSAHTPSIASVMTSNFGASLNSFKLSKPLEIPSRKPMKMSPMAGSLPITMAPKPKANLGAMSMVFGRSTEHVSKSWSDMWEEDEEEDEAEHARQLQALKELNSRTWSQDSKVNATPTPHNQESVPQAPALDEKSVASPMHDTFNDVDGDLVADGFFFHESETLNEPKPSSQHLAPVTPSKVDKWAVLGERRRAYTGSSESKSPNFAKSPQHGHGHKNQHGLGNGVWEHANVSYQKSPNKDRTTSRGDCPWNKGRDWTPRKEQRQDFSIFGWVGNWRQATQAH
ncbi:kinase-like domain-containing protein [Truncatella angustata]|uniref:non-specific serine/threonine protein kinase n=1 Tax=Truncatella angustata TaxID=152316 RepID=A0A9P8ULM3_9PEZI|nr:kinase-like domain-containing protein [Truncatella angustata]KAH6654369.1 kinase-like domain-containing protein [Truncatella angustata]